MGVQRFYRGGRGRETSHAGRQDKRFVSRFEDPRFQMQSGRGRGNGATRGRGNRTTQRTPSEYLNQQNSEENSDEESESIESGDESDKELCSEELSENQGGEYILDEEEQKILDEEVAAWDGDKEIELTGATKRIAIVECDWDHVRAHDIYAILTHAIPIGGRLIKVDQYVSQFGKEMIEKEKSMGPDLWVKAGEDESEDNVEYPSVELIEDVADDGGDEMEDVNEDDSDGWQDDNPDMLDEDGEDGEKFSKGKYRKYEMDRMKYYYCVATFDSVDTAAAVYEELDGVDIEASGVVLDLRYIEDSDKFEDAPVSTVTKLPPSFRPLSAFGNSALSQTKFRLSWDQDDIFRTKMLRSSFNEENDVDEDVNALIVSSDSEGDDEVLDNKRKEIRRKYSKLLAEIGGLDEEIPETAKRKDKFDATSDEEDGSDDDLNRFSDVDINSDDNDEDGKSEENEGMEATIDLDTDTKAQHLTKELKHKIAFNEADVGTKAQLIHKIKRKEAKKAKKEMLRDEQMAKRAAVEAEAAANKMQLRIALGEAVQEDKMIISGKQKMKEHSKQTKQRLAQERQQKRLNRITSQLKGAFPAGHLQVPSANSEETESEVDTRFASRLTKDPRFHIDINQKGSATAKKNNDLVKLASNVAKARRQQDKELNSTGSKRDRDGNDGNSNDVSESVE
eukprot:Tbor_TRINITY_DN4193_c0_g1::TRINITY_DN4193_c0_g1_i2::g.26530::m.26530